jgi:DNA-directed RNA polymerase subunit RPC12/RpoP
MNQESKYKKCPYCGKTIIAIIRKGILIRRIEISKAEA